MSKHCPEWAWGEKPVRRGRKKKQAEASPASACSAESDLQRDRRFLDETYGKMTTNREEQDRYMERLQLITTYRMWISEQNSKIGW